MIQNTRKIKRQNCAIIIPFQSWNTIAQLVIFDVLPSKIPDEKLWKSWKLRGKYVKGLEIGTAAASEEGWSGFEVGEGKESEEKGGC